MRNGIYLRTWFLRNWTTAQLQAKPTNIKKKIMVHVRCDEMIHWEMSGRNLSKDAHLAGSRRNKWADVILLCDDVRPHVTNLAVKNFWRKFPLSPDPPPSTFPTRPRQTTASSGHRKEQDVCKGSTKKCSWKLPSSIERCWMLHQSLFLHCCENLLITH